MVNQDEDPTISEWATTVGALTQRSDTSMQKCFLIIDPQHEYALELMRVAAQKYNLKPVCLYIDSLAELHKRAYFPELRTDAVLDHYNLDQIAIPALAQDLQAKYDVVGIMPYFEQSLAPFSQLLEYLPVRWNAPDVLKLFRNKSALKDHLRHVDPSIPMGASRMVCSAQDVFSEPLPQRYVIKPNDGFANRDIGFFDSSTSRDIIAAYFNDNGGAPCILEEFLEGPEYAINGQMDAEGRAMVVNVLLYERVSANGKPNVYHRTHHVPRTSAAFAAVTDYAVQVMQASGLKRCPFHMEVMLTDAGPRLIEVGARFGGTRYAFFSNAVHGGQFNVFELAAHNYLFDTPYAGAPPDWDFHDRISYVHLDGIAERTERVYRVEGVKPIEAMEEFDGWVVLPRVGGLIRRTVDLYTVPYSVHLKSFAGRDAVVAASEKVKSLLKINRHVSRPLALWVNFLANVERLQLRGRWLAQRAAALSASVLR